MTYDFSITCGEQEINHRLRFYNELFDVNQKVGSTTEYEYPTFLDHRGIAVYHFHAYEMSHMVYQPHLRHLQPLPPNYYGIDAELFRVYADLRTPVRNCPTCMASF